jgi:hypothetical protein
VRTFGERFQHCKRVCGRRAIASAFMRSQPLSVIVSSCRTIPTTALA